MRILRLPYCQVAQVRASFLAARKVSIKSSCSVYITHRQAMGLEMVLGGMRWSGHGFYERRHAEVGEGLMIFPRIECMRTPCYISRMLWCNLYISRRLTLPENLSNSQGKGECQSAGKGVLWIRNSPPTLCRGMCIKHRDDVVP